VIEGHANKGLVLREHVLKVISLSDRLSNGRILRKASGIRPFMHKNVQNQLSPLTRS
jgi:hypothetical protein